MVDRARSTDGTRPALPGDRLVGDLHGRQRGRRTSALSSGHAPDRADPGLGRGQAAFARPARIPQQGRGGSHRGSTSHSGCRKPCTWGSCSQARASGLRAVLPLAELPPPRQASATSGDSPSASRRRRRPGHPPVQHPGKLRSRPGPVHEGGDALRRAPATDRRGPACSRLSAFARASGSWATSGSHRTGRSRSPASATGAGRRSRSGTPPRDCSSGRWRRSAGSRSRTTRITSRRIWSRTSASSPDHSSCARNCSSTRNADADRGLEPHLGRARRPADRHRHGDVLHRSSTARRPASSRPGSRHSRRSARS